MGRSGLVAGQILGLLSLTACVVPEFFSFGAQGDRVLPVRLPEPVYDELFPYYAEFCAVSRFERIGVERGGSAGHSVMYLKGVCRDEDAPYPTVELCSERVDDPMDPRHGTGISVNAAFANVNWVAYPGRRLFYDGNLERGQTLDAAHFEATIRTIAEQGILRGVDVHEEKLTGVLPGLTAEERLAESLLGTDVAIRFARSIWCASMPLEASQVESVVAYLNELNQRRSFNYSLFFDNCVDTLHNSLAAAGVWERKEPPGGLLRGVVSMGIPANEVIGLAERGNLFPLEDFGAVRRDATMLESLETFGHLPTRAGALLKSVPVHRPNEIYDTSLQMYVVEGPGRRASQTAQEMISDGRYTDLGSNLHYYEARYQRILDQLGPGWWPRSDAYREDLERYRAYIAGQLDEVRELKARLYSYGS
ncbi:MAG: hypothetical protein ACR2PQ_10350 [Myxococcota bacterium]